MLANVIISVSVIALAILLTTWLLRRALRTRQSARRVKLATPPAVPPRKRPAERRKPPTALTALLREPFPLSEEIVAAAIERALGARPTHSEEDAVASVQDCTDVIATVQVQGHVLVIISMAEAYASDRDWYAHDGTPADLLAAWQSHRAWLSVDLVSAAPGAHSHDVYMLIGRLIAEFAGESALALLRPAKRQMVLYDDETRTLLRRTDPLQVVSGLPSALVVLLAAPVALDAPALAASVRRAWGADIPSNDALPDFAVKTGASAAVIQYEGLRLAVNFAASPCELELAGMAGTRDRAVRELAEKHAAWVAIELGEAPVNLGRGEVYRRMARWLAEILDALAPGQALLLLAPELQRTWPITRDFAAKLRAEDPLAMLQPPRTPPVLGSAH